ncbi:MAG: hypothetical protein EPN21_17195 [Methylococcaceae bacterium]|nr:MAG: hypothetical protein EPN21_17195 [Methylococcaceae bacterium]
MNARLPDVNHGAAAPPGWEIAVAQITGVRHRISEDSADYRVLDATPQCGGAICLALADGVGGGARGDIAGQALVRHCLALPRPLLGQADAMAAWLKLAEAEVQRALRAVTFSPGAATLAAAWLASNGIGHWLRVGDARLYRVAADGAAAALSHDQTYDYLRETPPAGAQGGDPARMVGTGCMGEPQLETVSLGRGDTLLLCSDGLHRGLGAAEMAGLLAMHASLEDAGIALVLAARAAGSEDDISVLLARRCRQSLERRRFLTRLRRRIAVPA